MPGELVLNLAGEAVTVEAEELTDPEIEQVYSAYLLQMARYEKAAQLVADRLRRELRAEARLRQIISFRAKHPEDLREKLRRKRKDYAGRRDDLMGNLNQVVTDLAGVRIVVYQSDDEERVVALIDRTLPPAERPDARPDPYRKPNGYRATHRLVLPPSDAGELSVQSAICEVQVTTLASHLFNELEHDITYKGHGIEPSVADHNCLRHSRTLTELLDAKVDELFKHRREAVRRGQAIRDAEALRFAFELTANRPLTGDFARLFRMLNAALEPLSVETLMEVGPLLELIDVGKRQAVALDITDVDDVTHFVLGANELHEAFVDQAASWRGPKTPLRRAVEKLALASRSESGQNTHCEDG